MRNILTCMFRGDGGIALGAPAALGQESEPAVEPAAIEALDKIGGSACALCRNSS